MSEREPLPRLAKQNIDYKIFHKHGKKVVKEGDMADSEQAVKEMQIMDDLNEAFDLFDLEYCVTVDEISEGMSEISERGREFRHIHIELKNLLGDAHAGTYPKYEETCKKVRQYARDGKTKIREIEQHTKFQENLRIKFERDLENKKLLQKEADKQETLKHHFTVDQQTFQERLEDEIKNFSLTDVEEIKETCARLELLLNDNFKLLGRAKIIYGEEFKVKDRAEFDKTVVRIREQIKIGKSKIKEISDKIENDLV